MTFYPLTFTPQLRDYIWGGRNLETLYQRPLPPGSTAESWEISGHPTAATVIDNGPLAGLSLPQALAQFGQALTGQNARWALERNKFPLLVKLLDATQNLSVQVHPNDAYALRHENGELGKTEMWYVLHAQPEAQLVFGLKPDVTPEIFRRAVETNTLENYLHYLPIKAGDAIFVAAGSIHALLAGAVVAEIQQNSDLTYRVYDWGRVGADGRARPLHLEQAMAVTNFAQVEPGLAPAQRIHAENGLSRAEISRCDYFVVEEVTLAPGATFAGRTYGSSLEIWGVVAGNASLTGGGVTVELPAVRFGLIPAALGDFSVQAHTGCTMLRVYLP